MQNVLPDLNCFQDRQKPVCLKGGHMLKIKHGKNTAEIL